MDEDEEDYKFPFQDCDFIVSSLNLAASPPETVRTVVEMLTKDKPKNYKYLDLGCGDGRYVFEAVKSGFYAVGIEMDPTSFKLCVDYQVQNDLIDKCCFYQTDFFLFDLKEFNMISCYLYEKTLNMMSSRLKERMGDGNCSVATILYKPASWTPVVSDDIYKIFVFDETA
ncbi:hypothetical protein BC833DRAFT_622680, partial [Globomyces pollinis-pini]